MECYRTPWQQVNIGSGNGLLPSGNKPLPEPMLKTTFFVVFCCFTYIFMPHIMIILYWCLVMFMSQIVLYFLHSTRVLSFYIDIVLALSIDPDIYYHTASLCQIELLDTGFWILLDCWHCICIRVLATAYKLDLWHHMCMWILYKGKTSLLALYMEYECWSEKNGISSVMFAC